MNSVRHDDESYKITILIITTKSSPNIRKSKRLKIQTEEETFSSKGTSHHIHNAFPLFPISEEKKKKKYFIETSPRVETVERDTMKSFN